MPPSDRRRRRGGGLPLAAWLAGAAAVAVYLNTLPAQFTFDDSFAVVGGGVAVAGRCCLHCLGHHTSPARCTCCVPSPASTPPRLPTPTPVLPTPPCQLYNGDVTDRSKPLRALLRNDFWCAAAAAPHRPGLSLQWVCQHTVHSTRRTSLTARAPHSPRRRGQDLRSPMSHKSYRPLTVLSFRAQHRLSAALLGGALGPAGCRGTAGSVAEAADVVRGQTCPCSLHRRGARPCR